MDTNIYVIIAALITEIGTIAGFWLRLRRGESKTGEGLATTVREVTVIARRIVELEKKIEEIKEDRERWQLRALQCEERERQAGFSSRSYH